MTYQGAWALRPKVLLVKKPENTLAFKKMDFIFDEPPGVLASGDIVYRFAQGLRSPDVVVDVDRMCGYVYLKHGGRVTEEEVALHYRSPPPPAPPSPDTFWADEHNAWTREFITSMPWWERMMLTVWGWFS